MEPREEGGRLIYPCARCDGQGRVVEDDPWWEVTCPECGGTGEYVDG
jgi:DnaJ-class molecular chaperone